MLQGLKISNGDLAVRGDGQIELVTGGDRIRQDLVCWTLEPYGTDRVHARFGSTLHTYIGTAASDANLSEMRAEVTRVLNNYIALQGVRVKQATVYEAMNVWTPDEVIGSVPDIRIRTQDTDVSVMVSLETIGGRPVSIELGGG